MSERPLAHECIKQTADALLAGSCDAETQRLLGQRLLWAASLARADHLALDGIYQSAREDAEHAERELMLQQQGAAERAEAMRLATNVVTLERRARR